MLVQCAPHQISNSTYDNSKWILSITIIKWRRDFFKLKTLSKASNLIRLADAWVSFVCGLYKILEVPYRDRRLGEPLAGLRRPIRGPLGSRGMGLEEFYTGQRQNKCIVWTAIMKEIFKTVVEPLISLPKWCFSIQTTLICVYHIILKEDAEKVLKSPSFYPPTGQGLIFT